MSKIEHTTNYEKFKFFSCNRKINQKHLNSLIKDEDFPKSFECHPIIIDKDFNIIDGQHRFLAAKERKIPIYYILDKNATVDTIANLNNKQVRWFTDDFLHFYAMQNIPEYVFMKEICDKYKIKPYLILDLNKSYSNTSRLIDPFKTGKLVLREKELLFEFCEIYFSKVNELKIIIKGKSRLLFTHYYVHSFFNMFKNNREKFEKLVDELNFRYIFLATRGTRDETYENLYLALNKRIG